MDVAPEANIPIIRRERQESIHPVVIHRFNEPIFLLEKRPEQIMLTNIIPTKTPACCIPESFVVSPGVKSKTEPAKGSRIKSCILNANIEAKTNNVNNLVSFSCQITEIAPKKPPETVCMCVDVFTVFRTRLFSSPQTARRAKLSKKKVTELQTMKSRAGVNGSNNEPVIIAVIAKPAIIISHNTPADAALFSSSTFLARNVSKEVPAALTPIPINRKPTVAINKPPRLFSNIGIMEKLEIILPAAKIKRPPIIHGVAFLPLSTPWPILGRSICTR